MAKRKPKSRIELLAEALRTADLRLRLAGDLGETQRIMAVRELLGAKAELENIIVLTKQGVYNG